MSQPTDQISESIVPESDPSWIKLHPRIAQALTGLAAVAVLGACGSGSAESESKTTEPQAEVSESTETTQGNISKPEISIPDRADKYGEFLVSSSHGESLSTLADSDKSHRRYKEVSSFFKELNGLEKDESSIQTFIDKYTYEGSAAREQLAEIANADSLFSISDVLEGPAEFSTIVLVDLDGDELPDQAFVFEDASYIDGEGVRFDKFEEQKVMGVFDITALGYRKFYVQAGEEEAEFKFGKKREKYVGVPVEMMKYEDLPFELPEVGDSPEDILQQMFDIAAYTLNHADQPDVVRAMRLTWGPITDFDDEIEQIQGWKAAERNVEKVSYTTSLGESSLTESGGALTGSYIFYSGDTELAQNNPTIEFEVKTFKFSDDERKIFRATSLDAPNK